MTVLSVTPRKEYEACPYCFVRLDKEITPEEEQIFETKYEEIEDEEEMKNSSTDTDIQKVKSSGSSFLDKVKALIPNSNGTQKKETAEIDDTEEAEELNEEEEEETTAEEQETEESDDEIEEDDEDEEYEEDEEEEEDAEEAEAETDDKETEAKPEKETKTSDGECPESFGYLANRPKDAPIPSGCLMCPKMVDCMLKTEDD